MVNRCEIGTLVLKDHNHRPTVRILVDQVVTILTAGTGWSMILVIALLYCTVLYCTVLYCTVLYCTVLY